MSELEEKQANCPYCHGTADLNDTANSEFQINIDLYDSDDVRLNVEYQGGADYDDSSHINYCPMCGRKLGENE